MIDYTRIALGLMALGAVGVVAWAWYSFQVERLRTPQPKPRYDFEGAITQLQDSMDAGGRAHVKRCDELEDAFEAQKRINDKRFYELEQQVMRLTNDSDVKDARFEARMVEVAAERNKLAQMLSSRVPHSRMG